MQQSSWGDKTNKKLKYEPTETQREIMESFERGDNMVVDAVPGSGKTTTCMFLAANNLTKNILVLTFSKRLADDTNQNTAKNGLTNIVTSTYHSLANRYYDPTAQTDMNLLEIVHHNKLPRRPLPVHLDLIVLDETQDMCKEQYFFIHKFFNDLAKAKIQQRMENVKQHSMASIAPYTQLVVLGDEKQCIFEFKGADPRFLTIADQIWCKHPLFVGEEYQRREFKRLFMNGTNRLTGPMVAFLEFNEMSAVAKNGKKMISLKAERNHAMDLSSQEEEKKVEYWNFDHYTMINVVVRFVVGNIDNGRSPGDIFIMSSSNKNETVKQILNRLVQYGVPCYINSNNTDSEERDDSVLQNKVSFITFHGSKGRERPVCIVLGFDSKYFSILGRCDKYTDKCPNLWYVATTRATEHMILCHESTYKKPKNRDLKDHVFMLPFLKMTSDLIASPAYIDFLKYFGNMMESQEGAMEIIQKQRKERRGVKINASDLTSFLSVSLESELMNWMEAGEWWLVVSQPRDHIKLNSVTACDIDVRGKYKVPIKEDVSDINGLAIPSLYFARHFRDESEFLHESLLHRIENLEKNDKYANPKVPNVTDLIYKDEFKMFMDKFAQLPTTGWMWNDLLLYYNLCNCLNNKTYHRVNQITNYHWLDGNAEEISMLMDNYSEVMESEIQQSNRIKVYSLMEFDVFGSNYYSDERDVVSTTSSGLEDEEEQFSDEGMDEHPLITDLNLRKELAQGKGQVRGANNLSDKNIVSPSENEYSDKSSFFNFHLLRGLNKIVDSTMDLKERDERAWFTERTFYYSGFFDLITAKGIWELKCTQSLSIENKLQLILYAWFWKGLEILYEHNSHCLSENDKRFLDCGEKKFHLFNVRTREHLMLDADISFEALTDFVAHWVDGKNYRTAGTSHLTDEGFLASIGI